MKMQLFLLLVATFLATPALVSAASTRGKAPKREMRFFEIEDDINDCNSARSYVVAPNWDAKVCVTSEAPFVKQAMLIGGKKTDQMVLISDSGCNFGNPDKVNRGSQGAPPLCMNPKGDTDKLPWLSAEWALAGDTFGRRDLAAVDGGELYNGTLGRNSTDRVCGQPSKMVYDDGTGFHEIDIPVGHYKGVLDLYRAKNWVGMIKYGPKRVDKN